VKRVADQQRLFRFGKRQRLIAQVAQLWRRSIACQVCAWLSRTRCLKRASVSASSEPFTDGFSRIKSTS
jgi:hypothetical protein